MSAGSDPAVLSLVWNLIRGGTEGQCARVAMGLAALGCPHRVAVFRREGFFLEAVEAACGPVFPFTVTGRFRLSTAALIWQLSRWIRREGIRVLHAWDMDACIFGRHVARLAGIPLITSRRDLAQIYPDWKLRALALAERQASAVVVNARAIGALAEQAGVPPARVRRIPNVLDVEEFDRLSPTAAPGLPPPSAAPRVVQVARLDPEKNTGALLEAAHRLRSRGVELDLVLAGDGVERPRLEAQAKNLGLAVTFLGDFRQVPALLATAKAGVLVPSANEGLSNTILEYLAAGLPCVVSDCGGNADLVRNGENGFVVPAGDPGSIADAIARVVQDPEFSRHAGARGRARVEADHRPASVLPQFRSLYAEVAHGRA